MNIGEAIKYYPRYCTKPQLVIKAIRCHNRTTMLISVTYLEAFYWFLFALDSVADQNSENGKVKGLS